LQLPAAHSLTGCETKHAALKSLPSDSLIDFGVIDLTDRLIDQAERFLVDIIKPAQSEVKTFNELRELKYYNYKSELELTKLPCASTTIRLHVIRAFYQCYRWVMAPNRDIATTHSPEDYAYQVTGEYLEPLLINLMAYRNLVHAVNVLVKMYVLVELQKFRVAFTVSVKVVKMYVKTQIIQIKLTKT